MKHQFAINSSTILNPEFSLPNSFFHWILDFGLWTTALEIDQ